MGKTDPPCTTPVWKSSQKMQKTLFLVGWVKKMTHPYVTVMF